MKIKFFKKNRNSFLNKIYKLEIYFCIITLCSCSEQLMLSEEAYILDNITIIDPIDGLQKNKQVVIENGTISLILDNENKNFFREKKVYNGYGKYLIPGLWDAHVHFSFNKHFTYSMHKLFLAYGVTSVRDTGGPMGIVAKIKDSSNVNPMTYPNVFYAGPLIDGSPSVYNNSSPSFPLLSIENKSSKDLESNTLEILSKEVDFLKAYEMLNEEQLFVLTEIGRRKGLNVTGHIPLSMNLYSAVKAGLNGMEHLRNIELSVAQNSKELLLERKLMLKNPDRLEGSKLRASIHQKQRMSSIESMDDNELERAAQFLAKNNVWQTPTLILYRNYATKSFKDSIFISSLDQLPQIVKEGWRIEIDKTDTIINNNSIRYSNWMFNIVKKLHQHSVPFMAGTDTPIGYLIPGISLHRELELLVKCGFSNLEAIQTATINPALYFGLENKLGRIKEGFQADMVILNENPLEKISNTKTIQAVIKSGNFLSRKYLDSLMLKDKAVSVN